jgi:uncharacterized protein (TIGR02466 family)
MNLFGIPIYINTIKLKTRDIKYLMDLEYNRIDQNNGYVTKNTYVFNDDCLKNIKKEILNHLNNFLFNDLKINKNIIFKMLNSWCTKHNKGDFSQIHVHNNSLISGVLYLKVNKDSGNLIFHKNSYWRNIFPKSIDVIFDDYNEVTSDYWYITPSLGTIVFFPSFLEHSVTKNDSDEDRYSCAFNFHVEGNFGNYLNDLKIKIN